MLVLSGHSHTQQHVYGKADGWNGDKPLHEYNVGANCGAFWSGVKDAAGVPDSAMSDGTPKGYALLDVAGNGSYKLQYRVAGKPASEQIGLHAPKVLRQGPIRRGVSTPTSTWARTPAWSSTASMAVPGSR